MKAKSKRDNKIYDVQIHGRNQDDIPISYCTSKFDKFSLPEKLDFNVKDDNKNLNQCTDYWSKYRAETARMILSNLITIPGFYSRFSRKDLIDTSVKITDELINHLSSNV